MFKHLLGNKVQSLTTGLQGILTSRSENLYGCNRYYIQPPVSAAGTIPDGWWVDEDDIKVLELIIDRKPSTSGGSKIV
jgi:hypothetical protein